MSFNVLIVLAIIELIYFGVMKFVRYPSNFQVDLYTPPKFNSNSLPLKSHHLVTQKRKPQNIFQSNHRFFVRLEMRSNCLLLSFINARERAAWGSHFLSLELSSFSFDVKLAALTQTGGKRWNACWVFCVGINGYRTQTPGFSNNISHHDLWEVRKITRKCRLGWVMWSSRWSDYPVHLLTDWSHGCRIVLYNVPYGLMVWLFVVTDSEPGRDSLKMFQLVWLRILKK